MADRSHTLVQAASIIFVLMTVLPLLIFTWTLYTLDGLAINTAQIGLGLSLVISLAGFVILRSIMAQLSELSHGLVRAAGDQPTPSRPQPASPAAAPAPGIGPIDELDEMAATMATLWQREAVAHVGHHVLVSLVRAGDPVPGTLQELTPTGLILNQNGDPLKIPYHSIAGIEPARPPGATDRLP